MSRLDKIPRIPLARLPTLLDEADRLAEEIGVAKLYIKRDDLTGLAGGGNKERKLEFDFFEILEGGSDVVLTAGGMAPRHMARQMAPAWCS